VAKKEIFEQNKKPSQKSFYCTCKEGTTEAIVRWWGIKQWMGDRRVASG